MNLGGRGDLLIPKTPFHCVVTRLRYSKKILVKGVKVGKRNVPKESEMRMLLLWWCL